MTFAPRVSGLEGVSVETLTHLAPDAPASLGLALVFASATPLLLLDGDLVIKAASGSFCSAFGLEPARMVGAELPALGSGEWGLPQLRSLLRATVAGDAAIQAYEMDLVRAGEPTRNLLINAQRLEYTGSIELRVVLAVSDVTAVRLAKKQKEDADREKQVLQRELQHRVANSLQIIASILMQSARKVQSDEARNHLHDAHHRVMSIASLQRHLAGAASGDVALRPYFNDLCDSISASMVYDHALLTLEACVDDAFVGSAISVSLGLIVTELVINALKHAFPDRQGGATVLVEYRSRPDGWRLSVEDNGIGMGKEHAGSKPGLGTGIVDALSKQLDATVTITDANPGTRVTITHFQK